MGCVQSRTQLVKNGVAMGGRMLNLQPITPMKKWRNMKNFKVGMLAMCIYDVGMRYIQKGKVYKILRVTDTHILVDTGHAVFGATMYRKTRFHPLSYSNEELGDKS
jgi:hypothetical protein